MNIAYPRAMSMSEEFERGFNAAKEYIERTSFPTPRWVHISEGYPNGDYNYDTGCPAWNPEYLVLIKDATITTTLHYNGVEFVDFDGTSYEVVCWAELPEAPDFSWMNEQVQEVEVGEDLLDIL